MIRCSVGLPPIPSTSLLISQANAIVYARYTRTLTSFSVNKGRIDYLAPKMRLMSPNFTGFTRYMSIPASTASCWSCALASPVNATIVLGGNPCSSSNCLIFLVESKPPITGILKSISTKSKGLDGGVVEIASFLNFSNACKPLTASA